jgi:hypothetical protein
MPVRPDRSCLLAASLLAALSATAAAPCARLWTGQEAAIEHQLATAPVVSMEAVALEREAPAQGGRVRPVLGNHEAMQLVGERRDGTADICGRFAGTDADKAAPWFRLEDPLAVAAADVRQVNALAEAAKEKGEAPGLTGVDLALGKEAAAFTGLGGWSLLDGDGPLWSRGYAMAGEAALEAALAFDGAGVTVCDGDGRRDVLTAAPRRPRRALSSGRWPTPPCAAALPRTARSAGSRAAPLPC